MGMSIRTPAQKPFPHFWRGLHYLSMRIRLMRSACRSRRLKFETDTFPSPFRSDPLFPFHNLLLSIPLVLILLSSVRPSRHILPIYQWKQGGPLRLVIWLKKHETGFIHSLIQRSYRATLFQLFTWGKNYTNFVGHKGWSIALFSSPCVFQCVRPLLCPPEGLNAIPFVIAAPFNFVQSCQKSGRGRSCRREKGLKWET